MDVIKMGKLEGKKDAAETGIDYTHGSFKAETSEGVHVSVNPEFLPYKNSILSSGRYHVYCIHPIHGSSTFYVEHNQHCFWVSKKKPPYADQEFIDWIGNHIDAVNH